MTDLDADGHRINNLAGGLNTVAWSDITGKPSFATVATSGSYNDLDDRPTIPSAVTVDDVVTHDGANPVKSSGVWAAIWGALVALPTGVASLYDWCVAQLAGKQDSLSAQQLAAANSGATAAKVAVWDGYAAQKANVADLPYALVAPGEWSFSGTEDWFSVTGIGYSDGLGIWQLSVMGNSWTNDFGSAGTATDTSVEFIVIETVEPYRIATVVATKTGVHLLDRAVNAVAVSAATELTMPAATAGKARDFLVRMVISGSTVPTIRFAASGNESLTYETDDTDFPVPDEAGTWLYSFTESDTSTFAVSLKKVNVVAQGGGT